MLRIYVASSWRNAYQQDVVAFLRSEGHEVYDFKNPRPGDKGFAWSDIDPGWKAWDSKVFRESLKHPIARAGLRSDYEAMLGTHLCVLVLPCGRSAHLEAGWFLGRHRPVLIYLPLGEALEPELMYGMPHARIVLDFPDLAREIRALPISGQIGEVPANKRGAV